MSVLYRLAREPLVHFLAIGALVFALFGAGATVPAEPVVTAIIVSPPHVERLAAQFETAWQRAPSQAELEALIEDHVREEVYYREALALGLDRDDTVIRRRLRQKMEFIGEGASAALEPDEAALRAHYSAHPERFAEPARVTFRQVPLDEPEAAATVRGALQAGIEPEGVGRLGLLQAVMEAAGEAAVDGAFGSGFFEQVSQLSPGGWQGPVASAYGPHLVEVLVFEPGAVLSFAAVRPRVDQDWRQAAAEAVREAQYAALRARYEVVLPGDDGE